MGKNDEIFEYLKCSYQNSEFMSRKMKNYFGKKSNGGKNERDCNFMRNQRRTTFPPGHNNSSAKHASYLVTVDSPFHLSCCSSAKIKNGKHFSIPISMKSWCKSLNWMRLAGCSVLKVTSTHDWQLECQCIAVWMWTQFIAENANEKKMYMCTNEGNVNDQINNEINKSWWPERDRRWTEK